MEVTDSGKRNFRDCVERFRITANADDGEGDPMPWSKLPKYVKEKTGQRVSKDALWRAGLGQYEISANMAALMAYSLLGDQGLLTDLAGNNLDFAAIAAMLRGEIDAYGREIDKPLASVDIDEEKSEPN